MNRVYNFLIIIALISGTSCSTLKKSQVKLIGNYYNTLTNYPGSVKKLNEGVALITLESKNLRSALQNSDSARVYALISAINQFDQDLILPDSILAELDVIEEYIRNYYVLAPNGFNIYKAFKSTSESIVGIFGFKSVVSAIMPDRTVEVSSVKKRKITRHFRNQSEQFRSSLNKVKVYIDAHLLPEINQSNVDIQRNVEKLFVSGDQSISSIDHYFTYNKYFIHLFQRVIDTRKLYQGISESISLILVTEAEIQRMTAERNKLNRDSKRLHRLAAEMEKIRLLLQKVGQPQ